VRLALAQASRFQQAQLNELIAGEDVRQARIAFLPRVIIPTTYIYTSPATGLSGQATLRPPSFIANNAVNEYSTGVSIAGEIDIARRLQAALARSRALLEAAHAGTEVARRDLILATREAYFGLALAALRRVAAEQNLAVAEEFERVTNLMFTGGEVAQVDVTRARLQTSRRRDELALARVEEAASSDSLRVLMGYDFTTPVVTTELVNTLPVPNEIERFTTEAISRRPEFTQFDAQRRAAEQEIRQARGERRPQLSYSVIGGFDTDSLKAEPLKEHSGVAATISLNIPLFDWGASKSRERQATLRKQQIESDRLLALRTLAQQFYAARAQAIAAAARIQLLTASLTDAQQNLDTSIARYRAGEAPIVEVTDAQNSLIAQRASLYQALFDYQIARARLAQATGQ